MDSLKWKNVQQLKYNLKNRVLTYFRTRLFFLVQKGKPAKLAALRTLRCLHFVRLILNELNEGIIILLIKKDFVPANHLMFSTAIAL